jgi:predicted CXXCH cytochrome family protein
MPIKKRWKLFYTSTKALCSAHSNPSPLLPTEENGMNYFLLISAVCAALLTSSPGWAASPGKAAVGGLVITQPPERSIVQGGLLIVVLKSSPGLVDEIQIYVNNRKQSLAPITFTQNVVCYDGIRLSYGLNTVKITGFKNNNKIDEIMRQVFYQDDLSTGSISIPAGFKPYRFHIDANEKECSSCHALDFRKAEDPQDPVRSPCYLCHKKMLSEYKFTHGPSAVWSCLMCHDGKSRNPKLAVIKPDEKSCSGCHDTSWDNKRYRHAPTAAGACTTCHNPHAMDRQYFLRLDTGDLCVSCHEEILRKPHVIAGFSGNTGHPLKRSPNPFDRTKDFNCASCHNPHASKSPVFVDAFDESKSIKQFCITCHKF